MEKDMAIHKIKLKVGTVYQKEENGIYYFRYQVNGKRKAVSLGTRNKQQALKEAEKYVPLIQATSSEVIAAHVQHARNLITPEKNLLLSQAWAEYEKSPDRATPDTVSEALAYKATFAEFLFLHNQLYETLPVPNIYRNNLTCRFQKYCKLNKPLFRCMNLFHVELLLLQATDNFYL